MNGSTLRFVVVKQLRGLVDNIVCSDNLDQFFKEVASKSVLVEHWMKNLIKTVLDIVL